MIKWAQQGQINIAILMTARAYLREHTCQRWILLLVAASITVLVTTLDWTTGSAVEAAPLFLIPTVVTAVLVGTSYGMVFAAADIALDSYDAVFMPTGYAPPVEAVTGIVLRITLYLSVTYLVGRVTSIAEDNVSIAQRLQQTVDTMNADINSAARLQAGLITSATPTIRKLDMAARISLAGMVGGDFLDVRDKGGVLHFCIGDISGKGVRAALFAATLKYLVLQAIDSMLSPSRTLWFLNRELMGFLPEEMFVTMVCGEIDGTRGTLTYASAGHEIQFLMHKGDDLELLQPTGTILALSHELDVTERSHPFGEDDTALFYTDGALDVETPTGRLGLDGLQSLFASTMGMKAREIVDNVFESLVNHVDRRDRDDITLLVVKREA